MKRILIAEDEPRLSAFLDKGLRAAGFTTTIVADGQTAAVLANDEDFDLLLLDIGLPGKDGFSVLRELRGRGQRLPVLVLTARDDVRDTIAGLEGGADDYVTKPFQFDELLARIRARLRSDSAAAPSLTLNVAGVVLDPRTRRVVADGREIALSARQFAMLDTFLRHPGQVLSREQLLSHVWGYDHDPESNVIDVYVGYLRKKIGAHRITTVRGAGYRFEI